MKRYLEQLAEKNSPLTFRTKAGKLAGYLGLVSNLVLGIAKLSIGLFSSSVSIMADAVNNLSDSASSLLTLFGFVIAGKPADKEHPYGHERFESISGMFISILVLFVGFQFLKSSIERIFQPQALKLTPLIFIILVLSIGIKYWQSRSYQTIGKKISSETIFAASQDALNDCLTTGVVLASSVVSYFFDLTLDGYVGTLVAIYILYSGFKLLKEFVDSLLGEAPSSEDINKMKNLLKSYPKILGFHDLVYHSYGGNHRFATVHIEIDDSYSLEKAHDMIDAIEKDFQKQLTIQLVCHVDPVDLKNSRRQFVRKKMKRFLFYLDSELSLHDLRLQQAKTGESLSFDVVVPRNSRFKDEELLVKIKEYCYDEFKIKEVQVVFDHNYLLAP